MAERDRGRGAGYEYQWDAAAHLLLCLLYEEDAGEELTAELSHIGEVHSVQFDGDEGAETLEDINLYGDATLLIQVKERGPDSPWKVGEDGVLQVIGRSLHNAEAKHVLLTDGSFDPDLRTKLQSEESLREWLGEVQGRRAEKRARWDKSEKSKKSAKPPADFYAALREIPESTKLNVAMVSYHPPTTLGRGAEPSGGLGRLAVELLERQSVKDPASAFARLRAQVMAWSFAKGGTRLSLTELREAVGSIFRLSSANEDIVRYLETLPASATVHPALPDLRAGRFYLEQPLVDEVERRLLEHRLSFLFGSAGSGKSAIMRILGWRFRNRGWHGRFWDFELQGKEMLVPPKEFVDEAAAGAAIRRVRPWLALDNVHLRPDVFQAVLQRVREVPNVLLLAAGRTRTPIDTDSEVHEGWLKEARVELATGLNPRGFALLRWWLEHEGSVADDNRLRLVLESARWSDFAGDFRLLRLAYEAFDLGSLTLRAWAVERDLVHKVKGWAASDPDFAKFLRVVASLGRSDLSADLDAVASATGLTREEVRRLAASAIERGLLAETELGSSVRFWHKTMAGLYFDALRMAGLGT